MKRKFKVVVDGETFTVEIEEIGVVMEGKKTPIERLETVAPRPDEQRERAASDGIITAPLPGVVSEVRVDVDDRVEAGAVLLVLEAMKMDNEIYAPVGGVVKEIYVDVGQQVGRGDRLIVIS